MAVAWAPALGAGPARGRADRRTVLRASWPFIALFAGFPLWWGLGIGAFIWPVFAVAMLAQLRMRPGWRVPPSFLLWLLFLTWVGISAVQLSSAANWLTYLFRTAGYLSATVVFLYVLNTPRRLLPTRWVVNLMVVFWAFIVFGGYLALLFPHGSFSTPAEKLLPASVVANKLVRELVHPSFAEVQTFIGYSITRPAAPFAYTNWWGGNFGILVPFVVAALRSSPSRRTRMVIWSLLVASIAPVVISVNRGLWISLAIGLVYAMVRLAARGRRTGYAMFGLLLLTTLLVALSPLGRVVQDRLDHPGSKDLRVSLYEQSVSGVADSPLLGYGVPLPPPTSQYELPNVGTQGQLWLVLVTTGFPGLALFLAWLLSVLWSSRHRVDGPVFWAHIAILIALIQLPFYGMLPVELHIVMIAAALIWRERAGPERESDVGADGILVSQAAVFGQRRP